MQNENIRVIEVVQYNLSWPEKYIQEADNLRTVLGDEIIDIQHIGSTAIPGMYAKPVIDILITVKKITKVDEYNKKMEEAGYTVKGEFGIPGRRFFIKGGHNRTHHVHIFQEGNPEIAKHLNFRDYLIAHQQEAGDYGQLKRDLAKKFRHDSDGYSKGKQEFVEDIDNKASIWAKEK